MPPQERQQIDRNRHPVASVLGAVLIGGREGDKRTRKHAYNFLGFLTGGGFAVYVAVRLITFGEEVLRHEWQIAAQRSEAARAAVERLTSKIEEARKADSDEHDQILDAVWETKK